MILYDTLLFTYILQSIFILDSDYLFTCNFYDNKLELFATSYFQYEWKKKLDWVLIKATDRTFLWSIILFQFSRMPLTLIGVLHHIEKYKHEDEQPDEQRGR